ncbi:hypothetical protein PO124_31855 [Bacillus licheniformis]|nr:hypothetical protein [Bacillus licheniformis]
MKFSYFVKENQMAMFYQTETFRKTATISVTTTQLRSMLGGMNMKSTYASVSSNTNAFTLSGKGFGHGIGMSQYGANARAAAGHDYKKI